MQIPRLVNPGKVYSYFSQMSAITKGAQTMSHLLNKKGPCNDISFPYLCSTHYTLAPHLLFLHKLNITSTDRTGTEIQE